MFLIDLNILFDLGPRRQRNDEAIALFKAERLNFCRLAISDELLAELKGNSLGKTDPILDLANTFAAFPVSVEVEGDAVEKKLAAIVFESKTTLSKNDSSDLSHLRTAITNNLAGLITNDGKVLNAAGEIERTFGIQVIDSAPLHCLGLPFEESCLQFWLNDRAVPTASSEQVRRPIFTDAVDHWQRFEQWLQTLIEALGPTLGNYRTVGPASNS